jgi:peptidyl-prolyl cis-trans isomerase D
MFEFVRNHNRVLQGALLVLILPSFVFFGIQGYDSFLSDDGVVAKVGKQKITQAEWDAAVRTLADRTRSESENVDPAMFDTPQFKQRALDLLLRDYIMSTAARDQLLRAPDARLIRLFGTLPDFAALRNADGTLNTKILEAQGMSPVQFQERLREQISVGQVLSGVESTATPSNAATQLTVGALFQVREVQWMQVDPKKFAATLNPTPEQLRKYFEQPEKAAAFKTPESADVQYVILDLESLKQRASITEEELRKSYDENKARFTKDEERRASHILIKAEKSAPAAARQAARARAEKLLAEVGKAPGQFAELARKNSEDAGSASNGGDLDYFGRGAMVKPFEDAAFALKPGQLSGIVESDFGYHIIQLTDIRATSTQPFEQVRAELEEDARKELARKTYAEAAEKFTNMVYEQTDSLKPVADELKLTVIAAQGVKRVPEQFNGKNPLANPRVLEALFNESNRSKGRNTEAIEIAPNTLVSARVVKHFPAARPAFEAVQAQVRERWINEESLKLAKQEAEKQLALAKQSPDKVSMPAPVEMSRKTQFGQPAAVLEAALRVPADKLPTWTTVDMGSMGTVLMKVNKVLPLKVTPEESAQSLVQYGTFWGKAEADAYVRAMRRDYDVKIMVTPKADGEKTANGG